MKLDPETQVVATLGSKEGFANMAQAITAPGDVILVPNPTYPIHEFGFMHVGRRHAPSPGERPARTSCARVERACQAHHPQAAGAGAVVSIEPDGDDGRVSTSTRRPSQLAKKLDLIMLSDIAYAEIYFDGNPPPSVLQVPGAIDIAVEFTSLSKTYNMPGWRMGFAVGNERLIAALARIKSYLDYGAFTPIQVAASAALNGPQECVEEIRATYKSRRDCLVESFGRAGWNIPAAAGDDVRLGAGARAVRGSSARSSSPSC